MVPKAVRNRVRLAQQRAAAEITAPMPRQKTCRLGGDHASLDAGQDRLGVGQRQADRLQSVSAFVEVQDCVFADHIVVVTDDPELDLEAHACPKGCHCGSARLSAADIPDQTPSPTFCHAPPRWKPSGDTWNTRTNDGGWPNWTSSKRVTRPRWRSDATPPAIPTNRLIEL